MFKPKSILSLLLCLMVLCCTAAAVEVETLSITPVLSPENLSPIAENLTLKTYRSVSVGGEFRAVDADGDALSFRIVSQPEKGTLTLTDGGFVYTPAKGKRGKDEFRYIAVDEAGNYSEDALVTIRIEKQDSKLHYADLQGCPVEYAAIRLSEEGIYTGSHIGGNYCFSPDESISRGEFLALCSELIGLQPLEGITRTGFYDDDEIELWLKPYVSAALLEGSIQGSSSEDGHIRFAASRAITNAEAAVMLNRFLKLTDTTAAAPALADSVPFWAAQAVSNLSACDISSASDSALPLTRGSAALLLSSALDVLENR